VEHFFNKITKINYYSLNLSSQPTISISEKSHFPFTRLRVICCVNYNFINIIVGLI